MNPDMSESSFGIYTAFRNDKNGCIFRSRIIEAVFLQTKARKAKPLAAI